jgi:hypothetical protein
VRGEGVRIFHALRMVFGGESRRRRDAPPYQYGRGGVRLRRLAEMVGRVVLNAPHGKSA